eukprot:1527054-Alexandrium_andersonii.AAC.1
MPPRGTVVDAEVDDVGSCAAALPGESKEGSAERAGLFVGESRIARGCGNRAGEETPSPAQLTGPKFVLGAVARNTEAGG